MASFTVKATFGSQTRKFAAPTCSIPTYEFLKEQLQRIFPSLGQDFSFSKLIFCPAPGKQLLIGLEVRTKADYDSRIAAYQAGVFPGGMLKVSVVDSTRLGLEFALSSSTSTASSSTVRQVAVSRPNSALSTFYAPSYVSATPVPAPMSHAGIPPPPIIYSSSPSVCSDSSSPFTAPPSITVTPAKTCCEVSQKKEELQTLLSSFIRDFDRIASSTFGITAAEVFASKPSSVGPSPPQLPPKPWTTGIVKTTTRVAEPVPAKREAAPKSTPPSHAVIHRGIMCDGCRKTVTGIRYKCMRCKDFDFCLTCLDSDNVRSKHALGHKFFPIHTPQDLIHKGVLCDHCELTIAGVRHKCLDCPDFDLCTTCIRDGGIEKTSHDPFHEFFEIKEPGKVVVHTVNSTPARAARASEPVRAAAASTSIASASATASRNSVPVHHPAICNLCENQVVGDRFKCLACPDFDCCTDCYAITPEQHPIHGFVKIKAKEDMVINLSAQPQERHGAWCNVCSKVIVGTRYKCMHPSCPDFDLCGDCEALPISVHPVGHPLLKMKTVDTVIPTVYRVGKTTLIPEQERPAVQVAMAAPVLPVRAHEPAISKASVLPQVDVSIGDLSSAFSHLLQSTSAAEKPLKQEAAREPVVEVPRTPSSVGLSSPLSQEELLVAPTGTMTPLSQQFENDLSAIRRLQESLQSGYATPIPIVPAPRNVEMSMPGAMPEEPAPFIAPQSPVTKVEMVQRVDIPIVTLPAVLRTPTPPAAIVKEDTVVPAEVAPVVPLFAKFVNDLNIADGQSFPPGAEFVKSWVLENTGSRNWPEGTELRFVAGDNMGSDNKINIGAVLAGSKATISTPELKAPEVAGRYVAYWRLFDDEGVAFGSSVWIDINVAEPTEEEMSSNGSLAASSIIMPQVATAGPPVTSPVITVGPSTSAISRSSTMLSEDGISLADSDMSLIDAPSIGSDGDVVQESDARQTTTPPRDLEYVVLYDEAASEEDF